MKRIAEIATEIALSAVVITVISGAIVGCYKLHMDVKKAQEQEQSLTEMYAQAMQMKTTLNDMANGTATVDRSMYAVTVTDETYKKAEEDRMPQLSKYVSKCNGNREQLIGTEDADKDNLSLLRQYINLIPDDLANQMVEDGWTINLVDNIGSGDGYITRGQTFVDKKVIEITNCPDSIRMATLHEIGHVYYSYNTAKFKAAGITTMDYPGFAKLYLHGDQTTYIYNNFGEITAQAFAESVLYPYELHTMDPVLYNVYAE